MQPIKITSRPPLSIWNGTSSASSDGHLQKYRKDLSWLHFDNEPREAARKGPAVPHMHIDSLSKNSK